MEKYLKFLKKCSLFSGVTDAELLKMLGCLGARVSFFDRREVVMEEGSEPRYIGVVLTGSVQTVQIDYFGNRSIVDFAKEGELFMESFACAKAKELPVSAVAVEPSFVMFIDSDHIVYTCENNCGFHQRMIFNLMRTLADKSIRFHQRIEVTSKRTTREKLISYLSQQSKNCGGNEFDIPFDRQELADYLEVDRSGLSSEIGRLRREGFLESRKNHFKLL